MPRLQRLRTDIVSHSSSRSFAASVVALIATGCASGIDSPSELERSDQDSFAASAGYDGGVPNGTGTYVPDPGDAYGSCDTPTYPPPADSLLWSSHGGSAWWKWCECRPDSAVLPADPRTLVQPGVSDGRAVAFNTFWKDCHVDPVAVEERGSATTCGELRASVARGAALMTPGETGSAVLFSGTDPSSLPSGFGIATFSAFNYNNLWRVWGMTSRPNNFDQLVSERYGAPFGNRRNPYPLPGENPNQTNGGSGNLPQFFGQVRDADGRWTGTIGITCHGCHSGQVGTPSDGPELGFLEGSGSPLGDHNLLLRDLLPLGYPASAATILNLNKTRGVNNASDVNLAFIFPDEGVYNMRELFGLITSGSTAGLDTPAWWNMGHRPTKFVDGTFPMDAPRVDMVFYTPITGLFGSVLGPLSERGQDWMREHGPDANDWVTTLESPSYPYPVDAALASEGSVLFHTLNLWGSGRTNPVRRPEEGNGSCASCHGAYAPRFFNDPAFVVSPELEGIAGYITPIDIIGTDRVRLDAMSGLVQEAGATNFFGYPPTSGTDQDCGPQNQVELRGDREIGYLAQPLHGIWATAPYFHNGSVPNLAQVLDPAARPQIWSRLSTPARSDQAGRVVMGYDTNLARAYDRTNVGWRYNVIPCERQGIFNPGVTPYVNCQPGSEDPPLMQSLLNVLYSNLVLGWNLIAPPILTRTQMEERKIYNTNMFGQGNDGHEFGRALTAHERLAILEYLKTL